VLRPVTSIKLETINRTHRSPGWFANSASCCHVELSASSRDHDYTLRVGLPVTRPAKIVDPVTYKGETRGPTCRAVMLTCVGPRWPVSLGTRHCQSVTLTTNRTSLSISCRSLVLVRDVGPCFSASTQRASARAVRAKRLAAKTSPKLPVLYRMRLIP